MTEPLSDFEQLSLDSPGPQKSPSTDEGSMSSSDEDDSLLYHMEKKYLEEQEVEPSINFFGTSPCKLATERHLGLLVLNRMNIASIGDEQRLASLVKNVSDVDLAFNDISDWNVIKTLLSFMPQLRRLNLSHNPLAHSIDVELPSCSHLTSFALNGVNLPLPSLGYLCSTMPQLQELHLNENHDYTHAPLVDVHISDKVSVLQLNACNFDNWSAVLNVLRAFPNVKTLFLSDNPDLQVIKEECEHTGRATRDLTNNVTTLTIHNCDIREWDIIESLSHLTQLQDLKCLRNPIFDEISDEERYHLVIGRLRNLKILNGSPISEAQREESERFFVRFYQGRDNKPAVWHELVEIHGNLDELVKVDLTPRKWALVTMRCDEKNIRTRFRIRLNKTVLDLMRFVSKVTGITVPRMRLFYHDVQMPDGYGPTELRFPGQKLHYLHIEDGDEFAVQSKLLPPEKSVLW
uniref:Ubiquitin-like domain-containing protein n=1 Tax=Panagrellus redivivus TaxID=6233 RepID=A0A7E4VV82_PANRE